MKPDLRALQELLERATPGPWIRSKHGFQLITADEMHSVSETNVPRGLNKSPSEEQHAKHLANLDLIVAAVNALPELLKEREMLREVLYRCVKELDYVQSVENCNSGLCATGEGKDCVEEGMKVLDVKDLSLERLKGTL